MNQSSHDSKIPIWMWPRFDRSWHQEIEELMPHISWFWRSSRAFPLANLIKISLFLDDDHLFSWSFLCELSLPPFFQHLYDLQEVTLQKEVFINLEDHSFLGSTVWKNLLKPLKGCGMWDRFDCYDIGLHWRLKRMLEQPEVISLDFVIFGLDTSDHYNARSPCQCIFSTGKALRHFRSTFESNTRSIG